LEDAAGLLAGAPLSLEDPILNFAALSAASPSLSVDPSTISIATAEDLLPWLETISAASSPLVGLDSIIAPTIISPPPSSPESVVLKEEQKFSNTSLEPAHLPSPVLSAASPSSSPVSPLDINHSAFPALYIQSPPPSDDANTSATKSRKRPAPVVEDDDEVIMKRMKNTEAARRSRARKVARLECLEMDVSRLESDKANLLVRLAVVENENASFMQREVELNKRIHDLELQLAESHRAMVMGLSHQR
jgi:hypothetical protein